MAVTFLTVAMLLIVVFVVVTFTVRRQVYDAVTNNLESSQRMFAALETRRQRELRAQAATIADSPTLNAALDTIQIEGRSRPESVNAEAIETIDRELQKVATRIEADALVLVDSRGTTLDAAGRMKDRWPRGRPAPLAGANDRDTFDGVTHVGDSVFRVVAVPLQLPTTPRSARSTWRRGWITITRKNSPASRDHRPQSSARGCCWPARCQTARRGNSKRRPRCESRWTARRCSTASNYAYRQLVAVGDTVFYALNSVDRSSRSAMREAMTSLAALGAFALGLALVGSFALARLLTEPIGKLSTSLAAMATSRSVSTPLPLAGSSREVDALTETFNALMKSVAQAEAQTEEAYTGAIRALAAALDARDPYTAGHSERVSVLSVAIGRVMALPGDDLEILRLGALLHDIGKIGVPDRDPDEARTAVVVGIRCDQGASGARRANSQAGTVSGASHSDCRTAS